VAAETDKDVGLIMKEGKLVDAALTAGVREALVRHVQAGLPVVEWRDGKCVWLTPDEIKQRIAQIDKKNGR